MAHSKNSLPFKTPVLKIVEEIVLSYNTTDACNITFAGTPWEEGDRIITTSFEHPVLVGPINRTPDYHGVGVKIVPIPSIFTEAYTVGDVLSMFF